MPRPRPTYAKLKPGPDGGASILDRDPECAHYDDCLRFAYRHNLDFGCPDSCPARERLVVDVAEFATRRVYELITTGRLRPSGIPNVLITMARSVKR